MLSDRSVHRNTSPDMLLPDSFSDDLVSMRCLTDCWAMRKRTERSMAGALTAKEE